MGKRLFLVALLATGTACAPPTRPAPPSAVQQPMSVVAAAKRLFVSSLTSDGLSVVDLDSSTTDYNSFLRAPNPMFALDIPTVRRPGALARIQVSGDRPLVISASSLDPQLRFVDANALVAVGAPVALPGRPVALSLGPDGTTVYALVTGADDGSTPPEVVTVVPTAALLDPHQVLSATATVAKVTAAVPVSVDPGGLAITDASGTLEAWVSDLSSPQVVRVDLATGATSAIDSGIPLGQLLASPAVTDPKAPKKLPAGAYVYGLAVGQGAMVGFDVAKGAVAHPLYYNGKVLPIALPQVPVSMTALSMVQVSVTLTLGPTSTQRHADVPILLMVPLVDGTIAYVDGYDMIPVDTDGNLKPNPTVSVLPTINALDSSGLPTSAINMTAPVVVSKPNPQYSPKNPYTKPRLPDVTMTRGVTRSRTWTIGWHVKLPGQDTVLGRLVAGGGSAYVVPITPVSDLGSLVQPGDTLTITSWHGTTVPSGCSDYTGATLTYDVTAVDGGLGRLAIAATSGGPPLPSPQCFPDAFVYSVEAGGYTLVASDMSKVWRMKPGDHFVWTGSRFVVTNPVYLGPDFAFTLAKGQDPSQMKDGATRQLKVSSGLDPVIGKVDVTTLQLVGAFAPGQPAVVGTGTGWRSGRLYVPYVATGAVISFDVGSRASQELLQ